MRIKYVSNARLPTEKAHGAQIVKTCEALARAGHDVELIVPSRRNKLRADAFSYYGAKAAFRIQKRRTLDLPLGRFGFLLQQCTFAISAFFHLRGDRATVYGRDEVVLAILAMCGRGVVWESHDGRWNGAARYLLKRVPIVVVSQGAKDFYTGQGVPAERINVIPNGIDLERFARAESMEAARKRLDLPQEAKIAMYIGRLDGWKGSATLLEASRLLPGVLVAVIGGEPAQVEALSKQYPRVRFFGFRPYAELPDNQAAADVLVAPNTGKDAISRQFTSPLKVLAHLASGRPLVASDLPSIRELTGTDAALLVPPDDPQALARGIERVLGEPVLAGNLLQHAGKKIARFSWGARAAALAAVLRERPA